MAAFLIIFPLILGPQAVKMPKSTGYNITFYSGVYDLFEFYKFIALILIAFIMLFMLALKVLLLKQPIYISTPLLVFTILIFLSTIYSINPLLSLFGLGTKWQGLVTYICYFIVFTFVYNTFRKKNIEIYILYLLIPASIIGILSMFSFYNMDFIHYLFKQLSINYDYSLIKAPIGNRISLGAYFSLVFPISFFALINYKKNIYIYFLSTLLTFLGLMVSQTRTAWIGVFLALTILLIKEIKNNHSKIKIIAPVIIFLIISAVVVNNTGENKLHERIINLKNQIEAVKKGKDLNTYASMRGFAYIRAIEAIKENPILGTGPDCYIYYGILYPEDYKKYPEWRNTTIVTKAHSEYLEIMSTLGIPAFFAYTFFVLQVIYMVLKKNKKRSKLLLAISAGVFSYIIQASANIGVIAVLPLFFCISAIILRYYSTSTSSIIWQFSILKITPYKKEDYKNFCRIS
jgi:putative inorganic carbon (HCO3(-)) transporter